MESSKRFYTFAFQIFMKKKNLCKINVVSIETSLFIFLFFNKFLKCCDNTAFLFWTRVQVLFTRFIQHETNFLNVSWFSKSQNNTMGQVCQSKQCNTFTLMVLS